jgi:CheY-like chemotaxis protein
MAAKILLVEDDNNLREIYEARLQAEGYTIVTAPDGEEALVVAKAEKPDLIISDVMMPRISGFEMLDILRNTEELKYIKVIMLTALGQAEDKTRANSLGADRYLVKSQVTLEDIVKSAHKLIDGDDDTTTPVAPSGDITPPSPDTVQPPSNPVSAPEPTTTNTTPSTEVSKIAVSPIQSTPSEPQVNEPVTTATQPSAPPVPDSSPISVIPPDTNNTSTTPTNTAMTQPIAAPEEVQGSSNADTLPTLSLAPPTLNVTPDVATLDTSSAEQEKVAVEKQIDNFASKITSNEATQYLDNDVQKSSDTLIKDDTVLSEAVNDLTTNTPPRDTTSSIDEATKSHDQNTFPDSTIITPTQPKDISTDDNKTVGTSNVTIANKKIIQPIKSEPKPGLDELLAAEEAKSNPISLTLSTNLEDTKVISSDNSSLPGSTFGPTASTIPLPDQNNPISFEPNDIAL